MNFTMYAGFSDRLKAEGAEAAGREAVRLGFSSVEFLEYVQSEKAVPAIGSVEEAAAIRETLARQGLSVACYSVGINLWQKGMTSDTVTPMEEILYYHARLAAALGSPFLHHTLLLGVDKRALTMDEALSLLVPVAIRVAKYAKTLGITCIYEGQGMYFNGTDGFDAFYSAVKQECPYVGVCGDVGNPLFVDESPLPFFQRFAGDIVHVHVKDYVRAAVRGEEPDWAETRDGDWLRETVIGRGCVPLADCLSVLRATGYKGAFALENNHAEDFELGVAEGMRRIREEF